MLRFYCQVPLVAWIPRTFFRLHSHEAQPHRHRRFYSFAVPFCWKECNVLCKRKKFCYVHLISSEHVWYILTNKRVIPCVGIQERSGMARLCLVERGMSWVLVLSSGIHASKSHRIWRFVSMVTADQRWLIVYMVAMIRQLRQVSEARLK